MVFSTILGKNKGAKDYVECNKILHHPNFEILLHEL
jgi:hypothetical protein